MSVAITHIVIKLLTRMRVIGLCRHLHARSVGWLIDAPLSIASVTSACGSDDVSLHRNRKLKGMLPLRSRQRSALLCVPLIDSRNPWNPPQVCYCSGSGTCNRSEICFSFFHIFLDFPLSVCHVIPPSALNYLPRVLSLLRRRPQRLIVQQLLWRHFSYCRNLWTKWKHHWLYQM